MTQSQKLKVFIGYNPVQIIAYWPTMWVLLESSPSCVLSHSQLATMLFHNLYAAFLLLLLPFVQFQPTLQTPTQHGLSLLHKAIVANTEQDLFDTKDSKESAVLDMRDQLLQIVLNEHGMNQCPQEHMSDRTIANHLRISRSTVSKHRNSKVPFKKMQPSRKKTGISKKSFIYQHNELCQVMVHFWNEHSTPSPNKKDVKFYHSSKPGDHVRVHDAEKGTFTVQCVTGKCKKDQRR